MLNIQTRISLSKKSKRIINKFWKSKAGAIQANSWKKISKKVKNELSKKILINQDFKCAYCERHLYALTPEIDHFAHKAQYARFSFNPTNLFYACGFCNSSLIKGQKNTIANLNNRYDQCEFRIVHPLRNDPNTHISFQDNDRVILDISNCTYLGKRTIIFFKYHKATMTKIRSRDLILQRRYPLSTKDQKELINECIAYK